MGREQETVVPGDQRVQVWWGWSASTKAQVQDHIDSSMTIVTLDGQEITGIIDEDIKFSEGKNHYYVLWKADVGILSPGVHPLTILISWKKQIFDGIDRYGPGSDNETASDECFLVVK